MNYSEILVDLVVPYGAMTLRCCVISIAGYPGEVVFFDEGLLILAHCLMADIVIIVILVILYTKHLAGCCNLRLPVNRFKKLGRMPSLLPCVLPITRRSFLWTDG